jgi:hypothetical protein
MTFSTIVEIYIKFEEWKDFFQGSKQIYTTQFLDEIFPKLA